MGIRTVVLATGSQMFPLAYRQWPGRWPCGDSLVGRTLFVPRAGEDYRADWLVCCTPVPELLETSIPKARRILIVQEPPEVWNPPKAVLDKFGYVVTPYPIPTESDIKQVLGVTAGLFWWYGLDLNGHIPTGSYMTLDEIKSEKPGAKLPLISTIVSNKSFLPGHQKRLSFTRHAKEVLGDRLQVFGYPYNPVADKRTALLPFKFHLAIENATHPHYWTEKLSDPLLARCRVFYFGASEVGSYFPEGAVVRVDINNPSAAIETILNELSSHRNYSPEIEECRDDIICKYNLPYYIDKLIDNIHSAGEG